MKRWNKLGGKDDTDYSALMQEHLDNGGSKDDDRYKMLEILRNYKIERTDWSAYGDVEWAQEMRNEKLSLDWSAKIR
jgi:hypothetical protein